MSKDGEIQVHKKLTQIDNETRTLIEVFKMADNEELPEVEM